VQPRASLRASQRLVQTLESTKHEECPKSFQRRAISLPLCAFRLFHERLYLPRHASLLCPKQTPNFLLNLHSLPWPESASSPSDREGFHRRRAFLNKRKRDDAPSGAIPFALRSKIKLFKLNTFRLGLPASLLRSGFGLEAQRGSRSYHAFTSASSSDKALSAFSIWCLSA
jgi:hypothetical protein